MGTPMTKRTPNRQSAKKNLTSAGRDDTSVDAARREVLKRIGMFGAYTAPAILAMTWSHKAAAIAVDSTSTEGTD